MANLNLSQFGENTSVSDADYTFVWDSAASISKKVSRNSWLNSGTLTSDAPVTISQTWNGTSSTVFTALKVNATTPGTTSSSSSLLLDLQVGGVSQLSVTKAGAVNATGAISTPAQFIAGDAIFANGNGVRYVSTWIRSAGFDGGLLFRNNTQTQSVGVVVEADNTLALRNGAAAQTFNVYGTYTSGSVYERMFMRYTAASTLAFQIGTEQVGATARPLEFLTAGVKRMALSATGSPVATLFAPSNTVSNILVLRNLSDAAKFQFYLNGSGNSEFYIGASNVLLSEVGNSYFNGGNVGIGTTSPTSKLQVTNGDVEIETVTSGIIMKAAGTANRFRITLNAGGTDFVITAL